MLRRGWWRVDEREKERQRLLVSCKKNSDVYC